MEHPQIRGASQSLFCVSGTENCIWLAYTALQDNTVFQESLLLKCLVSSCSHNFMWCRDICVVQGARASFTRAVEVHSFCPNQTRADDPELFKARHNRAHTRAVYKIDCKLHTCMAFSICITSILYGANHIICTSSTCGPTPPSVRSHTSQDVFGPQGWCNSEQPIKRCDCMLDGLVGPDCKGYVEQVRHTYST